MPEYDTTPFLGLRRPVVGQPNWGTHLNVSIDKLDNAALRPAVGDAVLFVSTAGGDSNDGRSWGTAKATIQAAIDAIPSNGGTVFLGAGDFTVSSSILYKQGLRLCGMGPGIQGISGAIKGTRIIYTGTSDTIRASDQGGAGWIPEVILENFLLDTGGSNTGASGIHIWNAHDFTIRNVVISGQFTDGILLDSAAIASDTVSLYDVRVEAYTGRTITNSLRIPPTPGECNLFVASRCMFSVNSGVGSVIKIEGAFRAATFLSQYMIGAAGDNGFHVPTGGSASNVWMIGVQTEGSLTNAFNIVPAASKVNVLGWDGPGAVASFGEGLIIAGNGKVIAGTSSRRALQIKRSVASPSTEILSVLKENDNPLWSVSAKGDIVHQPDLTTGIAHMLRLPTAGAEIFEASDPNGGFFVKPGGQIQIGSGTAIAKHLSNFAIYNPPSVAAGAQTTTTVTVTGAALGDTVVVAFSLDLQGMQLTGYVSAANTVTAVLRNGTAAAIDLAEGNLRADVWKH